MPIGAIAGYDAGRVYLGVTKAAALAQGWDAGPNAGAKAAPVVPAAEVVPTAMGPREDAVAAAAPARASGRATGMATDAAADAPFEHRQDTPATHANEAETLRVPVHEEELTATTREREAGRVELVTHVVAEERVLAVPVTEERVRVGRVAVDRDAAADGAAFQGGTIAVPLRGEDVELRRRARVVEEVEVKKEAVRRTERVAGTVRRETVTVREENNPPAAEPGHPNDDR